MRKEQQSGGLSNEQGMALVVLARRTIACKLGVEPASAEIFPSDPAFSVARGTFVTLKSRGCLRGCIGCMRETALLPKSVARNAINAAFHDPRFAPLRQEELDEVAIEVSILTEPIPLAYAGAAGLLAAIRPGIDGVIIVKGGCSATFLPQVWEQLPTPETFLAHLCMKAGLPPDAWRAGDLAVSVYQVQCFSE